MLGNRTNTSTSSPDPLTALHEADAIVAQYGYDIIEVDRTGAQFVATALKTVGPNTYTAQAIGRTSKHAVEQLVSTITRR